MVEIVLIAALGMLFVAQGFCLLLMDRNQKVHKYRRSLLRKISDAGDVDIENNRPWEWRHDIYDTITYDEMLYKFWRRLDSFYPDRSFLDPEATRDAPDS
jgi:hypothetical protein